MASTGEAVEALIARFALSRPVKVEGAAIDELLSDEPSMCLLDCTLVAVGGIAAATTAHAGL